jgi:hypothetical protein
LVSARTVRRNGISLRKPCRQTGKKALRFDPSGGRGGLGYSSIAPINDRHPGCLDGRVTFDQTAAKSFAPHRFS